MAGTKKIDKAKKIKKINEPMVNVFELIADNDGNPSTPLEHDEAAGYEGELFFKADDDASEDAKKKILILNFIHQELKHVTERKVPVLDREHDDPNVEVYHRATFHGFELDVCVYWAPRVEGAFKTCVAMVKLTSEHPSADKAAKGRVETDAAWNADSKADAFTCKNDKLAVNYWAPRWKYIVNALKSTAYFRYEKNGEEKPPEPEAVIEDEVGAFESQEEREEQMSVYAGSTGKIIGPKGAKIMEIKKASNVKDIKMPAKNDDGAPRPKARELVEITIIGKPRAIAKAKELIQEVVDEWANAPREPRGGIYEAPQPDFNSGADGAGDNFGGGDEKVQATGGWANDGANGDAGDWGTKASGGGAGW